MNIEQQEPLTADEVIDIFERVLVDNFEIQEAPLKHTFTDGMYIREIFMEKDSIVVSMKHKTEHPFFVMYGRVEVYSETGGYELIEAPYSGVTKPGTRRVLRCLTPVVWATAHACTNGETVEQIVERITEKRENILFNKEERIVLERLHKNGLPENK